MFEKLIMKTISFQRKIEHLSFRAIFIEIFKKISLLKSIVIFSSLTDPMCYGGDVYAPFCWIAEQYLH